ncbi:MAG: response regulator transcription factor [Desulfobacterales bacterium]|nr:response regulator transcription factor [Desulfobacterales bacterium]
MKEKKKIVIAEDHTILREGLRALLSLEDDFEVIGEAEDGINAIRCVDKYRPDLILLDLSMPRMNGIPAIKAIKNRFPETKILTLTVHKSEEYIIEAFESGANGYCLKDTTHRELLTAIKNVLSGKLYLSPEISQKVLEGYIEGKKDITPKSSWSKLTQREKEILKLIGEGYKNREIAEYLFISIKTIEKHRSNLMKKLGLHNASALTSYAIEKGLVTK